MDYLDLERLSSVDTDAFRRARPYPWANPAGLIHEDAYHRLVETLPDVSLFKPQFGQRRLYGQHSHDRFVLECTRRAPLSEPWTEFLEELRQPPYRSFLERLLGRAPVALRFHWLYTPPGCSVSPHCDGEDELGTHIFYFNAEEDWDSEWGGATLVLDDGTRLSAESAPWFDSFESVIPARSVGNHSLIFARTDCSWHGVEELRCPADRMRKVFSVIVSRNRRVDRLARLFARPRYAYY